MMKHKYEDIHIRRYMMSLKVFSYTKKGFKESNKFLFQSKLHFFGYFIFSLASIISQLFFITFPIFSFAKINLADKLNNGDENPTDNLFEDANHSKKVWTGIIYYLIQGLLLIAGILVIYGLVIGIGLVGGSIDQMLDRDGYLLMYIFEAVVAAFGLVLFIFFTLYLGPTMYIIKRFDNVGVSDAMMKSFQIMKKNGKGALFITQLLHLLQFVVIVGLSYLFSYLAYLYLMDLVFFLITYLLSIIVVLQIPRINLSYRCAVVALYEDLINLDNLDDFVGVDSKQDSKTDNDNLVKALFTATIESEPEVKLEEESEENQQTGEIIEESSIDSLPGEVVKTEDVIDEPKSDQIDIVEEE